MDGIHLAGNTHRFTVADYHRMGDAGVFAGDTRVELIDGVVVDMPAIGTPHLLAVNRLTMLLAPLLAGRAVVSVQNAVRLGDTSEPEPDIAIVRHPDGLVERPDASNTMLVIEVSDTTLDYDRTIKSALYARAGLPEYWIVDLIHFAIEVRRSPVGDGYSDCRTLDSGRLSLLALPDASIAIEDVLPGRS